MRAWRPTIGETYIRDYMTDVGGLDWGGIYVKICLGKYKHKVLTVTSIRRMRNQMVLSV